MRALYGIQGTGNGHLARARALAPALRAAGVELDFVCTGRRREDYFDMETFNGFDCFRGMSLVVRKGNLKLLETIVGNNIVRFARDMRKLDLAPYDVVISDFEPLTAWAARGRGIQSIGVSHQCAFDYAVPKVGGYRASRMIMKHFAPTGIRLGLHWHHFGQPVLPPLITRLAPKEADRRKVLVYMMWEALDDLVEFVKPFSGQYDFLIYAPVREERTCGGIRVRPLSHTNFHRDMRDCLGVISNAGFELSSECLAMGKNLLLKPIAGQYEQLCNALALQSLRRATVIGSLDRGILEQWLELPRHEPVEYPDVAGTVARWIAAGRPVPPAELARDAWRSMNFPLTWDSGFGTRLRPGMLA